MKFLILVWCLFLIFYQSSANSLACSIQSLIKYQPRAISLRSYGDNFIISNLENTKTISSKRSIFLYCESFSYQQQSLFGSYYESSNSVHELFCGNDGLIVSIGKVWVEYDYRLKCENELSFNQVQSNFCNHQALEFGIKIRNVTVVIGEICYNLDNMNIAYIYYTTSRQNILLNKQIDHNPSSEEVSETTNTNKFTFDHHNNLSITIQNNLTMHRPQVKLIDYELSELVANSNFNSILKNVIKENDLPLVPWWKPLKDGNWITYQQILKTYARNENISVFTGTSHTASYPENFLCSADVDITYEENSEENNIPLYIWSYVKIRNETSYQNDVVIIGLNTPFFEPLQILCTDICSDLAWLDELEVTRKMPAFGYIFCCDPAEVEKILAGFPR